jgi:hypothetical protein
MNISSNDLARIGEDLAKVPKERWPALAAVLDIVASPDIGRRAVIAKRLVEDGCHELADKVASTHVPNGCILAFFAPEDEEHAIPEIGVAGGVRILNLATGEIR